jgi:hypothetical protein
MTFDKMALWWLARSQRLRAQVNPARLQEKSASVWLHARHCRLTKN